MPRALISAGHTVMDPGDVYGDLREADLTRKIAQRVVPHLKQQGLIAMSVPLDLPLLQRIDWINNTGYRDSLNDVCVEIHINSGGKRGLEAWYKGEGNNSSQRLAEKLVETVNKETGYASLGAHSEYEHELGSLSFLNRTNPVTIIIETLFIDNEEDVKILKSDQKLDELAKAIASGIAAYFHQQPKPAAPPVATMPHFSTPSAPAAPVAPPRPAFTPSSYGQPPMPPTSFAPQPTTFGQNQSGFGAFNPPAPTPGGGFGATGNLMQDREQRKEMIKKRYIQILGREPGQNDINYFLNIGITEDQLIKRMIDSQEHVELVKAKQELSKIKEELEKAKEELVKHKAGSEEKTQMVHNLEKLMQEKNQQIQRITKVMINHGINPDQYLSQTNPLP